MPGLGEKEWRALAELIGEVTLGWNQTVYQLRRVFTHLTGLEGALADAIFFSHQSDRAQRALIVRIAEAVELSDLHLASLKKLLKRLDKVATHRNLAAHTIFGISVFDPETGHWVPTIVPAVWPAQDKRLKKNFTGQFRKLVLDLAEICRDLDNWIIFTPYPARAWGVPPFAGGTLDHFAVQSEL